MLDRDNVVINESKASAVGKAPSSMVSGSRNITLPVAAGDSGSPEKGHQEEVAAFMLAIRDGCGAPILSNRLC
jgi:hypothetical protein